jgi:YidC/Oxa1 family membrane protein insertase
MLIVGALFIGFQLFFNKPTPPAGSPGAPGAFSYYAPIPQVIPPLTEGGAAARKVQLGDAMADPAAGGTKVALIVNTQTAGVELAQLNVHDFAETVKRDKPLTLFEADPVLARPFATIGVHLYVDDKEQPFGWVRQRVGEGDKVQETVRRATWDDSPETIHAANSTFVLDTQYTWKVTHETPTELDLAMTFTHGDKPLAEITKSFRIDPASYEVKIWHTVKNLSDSTLKAQIDQLGPSELPRDDPQADDRLYTAMGLNSTKKILDTTRFMGAHPELVKYTGGTKAIGQMGDFAKDPVLWVASSNRFFTTIVRPLPMDTPTTLKLASSGLDIQEVHHLDSANLDVMKFATHAPDARGVVRFTGSVVGVGRGETVKEPLTVFMGPKKREVLDGSSAAAAGSDEYARAAYEYKAVIQLASGCWCYAALTSEWLAGLILGMLNFFMRTVAFGNYGVAIMILVIVVRALLHPLTRSSQINMAVMGKKMKDVAPLLEAAKKRYPNNKQKQTEEQMRIYKENNVNPAGGLLGCLPMLIQMPIWAALWAGLRTDIDLRHQPFIPGWINDLSHPDTVLPSAIPVIGKPLFTLPLLGDIYGLNLLPLLLAVVFFFQMKVTTASQPKPTDEQQAQMQKMSQYMIFLFPLFLYSAPSGLNLYIFASTIGGLIDTWLVRKTLKKRGILPATAQALPTHEEK